MMTEFRNRLDDVPRPVALFAGDYCAGASTGRHRHGRGQLLHASSGLMRLATEQGHWVVPLGHAVWIPGAVEHEVFMHGEVAMRTVYVAADVAARLPGVCKVIEVSALLRATIMALAKEPVLYDEGGRGGHLANLILDEIACSIAAPLALPMPRDRRLSLLVRELMAQPALELNLDDWAQRIAMSRRSLTRSFRSETGLSFGAWRRRMRAMTAATLMADGTSLAVAARQVGYRSPRSLPELSKS